MTVGIDKLTRSALLSVVEFLRGNLAIPADYSGAFLSSPEFDHDFTVDGTFERVDRAQPYCTVVYDSDRTNPWEIGNKQVERTIRFEVWVVCESFDALLFRPQQVQQLLLTTSEDLVDGGIRLFDFDTGSPVATSDIVEIIVDEVIPFDDIGTKPKFKKLKHVAIIPCRIEEEKIKESKLIS